MKELFKVNTRVIVATGLGAAIFTLLFMYVKIPSPIQGTSFQSAYGIGAFFAVLFGPVAGGLIAFIGHALSDATQFGAPWWSWVISSGVAGMIFGFAFQKTKVEEGEFKMKDIVTFNKYQIIAHLVAFVFLAPVLDIVIYSEPVNLVFTQGMVAASSNILSTGVIGTFLLISYAATRSKKGSLEKEEE